MLYLALLLPALCMVEKMLGQEKPVALSLDSVIPYSLEIVQQIVVDVVYTEILELLSESLLDILFRHRNE